MAEIQDFYEQNWGEEIWEFPNGLQKSIIYCIIFCIIIAQVLRWTQGFRNFLGIFFITNMHMYLIIKPILGDLNFKLCP